MPDGEGFRKPIDNRTITGAEYKEALTILLRNFWLITVYGLGDYGDLHEKANLSPQCQVQPDESVIVGWAPPQEERLFQKFTRFSDGVLKTLDNTLREEDMLSADAARTNSQYCIVTFKSISHFYNVLVALCNGNENIGYDKDTDLIDLDGTEMVETQLPRARRILFGGSGYGLMPRKRQLN